MIDFFDKIYSIREKYRLLDQLKLYSLLRFTTRVIANILLPVYFKITSKNINYSISYNYNKDKKIVVSLTSFPQRINRVWLVVESIMRQELKPDRLILWLSTDQFNSFDDLPENLIKLQKRGLEIRLCSDDLRSHKKYFYAVQENPNDIVITVDDDVFYNSKIISNLMNMHIKYPSHIICNSAKEIGIEDNKLLPYKEWRRIDNQYGPSLKIMPIGVGGVLYPPDCLHNDVFKTDIFKRICLNADDIWLNFMSHLKGTKVVKTDYRSNYLPIINLNNITLNKSNVGMNMNDKQIRNLINYYCNKKNNFQNYIYESTPKSREDNLVDNFFAQ